MNPRLYSCVFLLAVAVSVGAQTPSGPSYPVMLPTSKMLRAPVPGRLASMNSFPGTMVVSPDGRYAATLNYGYGTQDTLAEQSISLFDLKSNKIDEFPDERFSTTGHQSYFVGLAFSSDGKYLYASVGSISDPTGATAPDMGNGIAVYKFSDGEISPDRFIAIAPQALPTGKRVARGLRKTAPHTAIPYPAGLAVIGSQGHDKLLVADNLSDDVVLLDVASRRVLQRFDLSTSNLVPSSYPYTVVATRDGKRAWCSLWNASQVAELDLMSGKVARWINLKKPDDPIAPGSHPTALLLSPNEKILYVALSNIDQVAVVDTDTGLPSVFLQTASADQKFAGASPIALAQTTDGNHLFVADASLDAVAVFDVTQISSHEPSTESPSSAPLPQFIPTDWYPSSLGVLGNVLLIATGKGVGTGPNPGLGRTPYEMKRHAHPYIPTLLRGSIARLNIPSTLDSLPQMRLMFEANNLFRSNPGAMSFAGGKNPIKHVIYVIKENRTFDQILGDLGVGNGDPSLTMFGEDITPNEHKLARQFGVLDNFYDSGEVSGDGHPWSTAAITSDYDEKNWQIAYRGKERTYDFQGQVADEFPLDNNQPDVNDPSTGYLWDNLARNHVSYRDYGEYVNAQWCNERRKAANPQEGTPSGQEAKCPRTEVDQGGTLPPNVGDPHGGKSPFPWLVPLFSGVKPTKAVLRDHFDPLYPDFQTDYPDQLRADEFLNEFEAYVRARQEHEGENFELPQFVLLYLPDDHTGGTRPDHPRPAASVADNDLALGRVVDAVSHSPYWDDTAIFVLEDDAQDGADHVDAHRSIAFVISKYSPGSPAQPYVERHFHTTVSMIHTMEVLLGLPPMNLNDAYAPVMDQMFSGLGNQPVFKADYRNLKNGLIYERNRHEAPGAKISMKMDFSRPDAADARQLNEVLWRDQKGSAAMPAAQHNVIPAGGD